MRKLIAILAFSLFVIGSLSTSLGTDATQDSEFLESPSRRILTDFPITIFPCSAVVNDASWTYSAGFSTLYCDRQSPIYTRPMTYLGPYATGAQLISQGFSVGPHKAIIVSVRVIILDMWDRESFQIFADGVEVYSMIGDNRIAMLDYCQASAKDIITIPTFGFNHTASTVTFKITSTLDEGVENESWGICDFKISLSSYRVTAAGNEITTELISSTATYFGCSGPSNNNLWDYLPSFSTITCGANTYLGPYASGAKVLSPPLTLESHQSIRISFKLAFIDSWDNEYFQVLADGVQVYSALGSSAGFANSCQVTAFKDEFKAYTFGLNHTASKISLALTSNLDSGTNDESWGICDLTITLISSQIFADGTPLIIDSPTTFFSCSWPANHYLWQYSPVYILFQCVGNSYLGPYGKAGKVTSPSLGLATHTSIKVSFKFVFSDSWDNEAFQVFADGVQVFSAMWNYANSVSNTCFYQWNDYYSTYTFAFPHTANTVAFVLTSSLDQALEDESWGICDFTITPIQTTPAEGIGNTVTYFACSGPDLNNLWSYLPYPSTFKCGANIYLGPYGKNARVTSPSIQLVAHMSIRVSVKVAFIDSWDSEYFQVFADNVQVFSTMWNLAQSPSNVCLSSYNDVFKTFTFGFNHTASTVTFVLTSNLDEPDWNEAWGICDLTITLLPSNNILADGTAITNSPLTSTTRYFNCVRPEYDILWQYPTPFSTVKCDTLTYLGPYGKDARLVSPKILLNPHTSISIAFRIAFTDSWDGESFKLFADGVQIFSFAWTLQQTSSNLCLNVWNDYSNAWFITFPHTASSVTFVLTSTLDEASDNEAWSLCDFLIYK